MDLIKCIPCELDLTYIPFCDTTIPTCEIELNLAVKKIYFNLFDHEYFTIPYVIDTIPNTSDGHKIPVQANKHVWIIAINGEYIITDQDALDELQHHNNQRGEYKVNIRLFIGKIY